MRKLGEWLERIGSGLTIAGVLALAVIFVTVLLNGSWPDYLLPMRDLFRLVSRLAGPWFAFAAELAIATAPGWLLMAAGSRLRQRGLRSEARASVTR